MSNVKQKEEPALKLHKFPLNWNFSEYMLETTIGIFRKT